MLSESGCQGLWDGGQEQTARCVVTFWNDGNVVKLNCDDCTSR